MKARAIEISSAVAGAVALVLMALLDVKLDTPIVLLPDYWPGYVCAYIFVCVCCIALLVGTFRRAALSKQKRADRGTGLQIAVGAVAGVLTFSIASLAIHEFYMMPMPDIMWGIFRILLPVTAVALLWEAIGGCKAGFVWISLVVQYILLLGFARPLGNRWGYTMSGPLAGWNYFGSEVMIWPLAITAIQFAVLFLRQKVDRKRH